MTQRQRVGFMTTILYCLPVGGIAFLLVPSVLSLQAVYPKYYGLSYSTIATGLLLCQIASAIASPVFGILSDRWREQGGSRRGWVIVGFVLYVVSNYYLLVPPQELTAVYFTFWIVMTRIWWAMFDTSHLGWGIELASACQDRIRIFTARACVCVLGASMFYILPLLPYSVSTDVSPDTLKCAAYVGLLLIPPVLFCCWKLIPDGVHYKAAQAPRVVESVKYIVSNRPFVILVVAVIFTCSAEGMWLTLASVMFDQYYGMVGEFPIVYLIGSLLAAVCLPTMVGFTQLLGKKKAFASLVVAFMAFITLGICARPGHGASILMAAALIGVVMVCNFNGSIISALLADVVDYGLWKFGQGQGAAHFSVYYLLVLIFGGLGGPAGLAIIERSGFSPRGVIDAEKARIAVEIAFFTCPIILSVVALVFIWQIPICARRAAVIRKRIEARGRGDALEGVSVP